MLIGFIGQGFIGKSYADDFERRGFSVVRYALEEPYVQNKEAIKTCDVVFVAVPTPTKHDTGFDDSIVRSALGLVGEGNIAVIKSTILPGTTERLQKEFPKITVLHSPEFLSEATAAEDAAHPVFNIIGVPEGDVRGREAAERVMATLPQAGYSTICTAREAELFKYLRNCFFYTKVVYMNLLYDVAQVLGADWSALRAILARDPWIAEKHLDPVHKSGRGAGGNCFVKDFAAFAQIYASLLPADEEGLTLLKALENKNIALLRESGKGLEQIRAVYGVTGD
ncbi:MAG: hypothetical protein Q8R39_04240 [bacterium]|nr:hypothetical protein [bacterium]MDZ4284990.1 hypothetical protein [Patescibacteria group bacterium]